MKGIDNTSKFVSRVIPSYVSEYIPNIVNITDKAEIERNREELRILDEVANRKPIVRDADGKIKRERRPNESP